VAESRQVDVARSMPPPCVPSAMESAVNPASQAFKTSRWSTDEVAPHERFDYYANALSSALVPMSLERPPAQEFTAEMVVGDLGGMAVVRQHGTAHRCFVTSRDLGRNQERSFHLLVNLRSAWNMEHRGRSRMAPGEAILTDSAMLWDIDIGADYEFVHLKFSEHWMRQWLPSPGSLVGRRIAMDSTWGRALSAFIAPLSPAVLQHSPLPVALIADQVGSLLALAGQDMGGTTTAPPRGRADHALLEGIKDCMRQLCTSPTLTASDVAGAVGVSLRTFHRCFQRFDETFGTTLTQMRCVHALRMLESPLFRRVGVGEIARRAGFCDASHLCRVVRARTGLTPGQVRSGERVPAFNPETAEEQP